MRVHTARMGSYWSVEECAWVEYVPVVVEVPEPREAEPEVELVSS